MTDREFWQTIYRHLKGILDAIERRWLSDN
jgi:hypothetical protein